MYRYERTVSFQRQQTEQEIFYDINTETAKYFSNLLLNDDEGKFAREYFQKRNIKTQTMRTFGLGYALRGWENFINFSKETTGFKIQGQWYYPIYKFQQRKRF